MFSFHVYVTTLLQKFHNKVIFNADCSLSKLHKVSMINILSQWKKASGKSWAPVALKHEGMQRQDEA
jgi:hypothetical protein